MNLWVAVILILNGVQGILVLGVLALFGINLRETRELRAEWAAFKTSQLKHDRELMEEFKREVWRAINTRMISNAEARAKKAEE
jgi:hypothetical protein